MTERVLGPTGSPRRRRTLLMPLLAALVVGLVLGVPAAIGSHPEASLPGSTFEIDVDANLKVDDAAPSIDWASVNETRKGDEPTGQSDDSYSGGSKEDDACPGTGTGSIPNNKSDLLTFGAYVEPETGGPGFLHMFWHRVEEPSGTTLMDFELNKSSTGCGNGVNLTRTEGDLLIEYRIEQGGASATLKVREWTGTAWGAATDLTAASQAVGTINDSDIPNGESDGIGFTEARTFGEMTLDLDFVFDENDCESFGSAFLKSRASDSFTSQLKDFIKPVPINLTNCGTVIIRKQTDPATDPSTGPSFGFQKSFGTDPSSANTFVLRDDGVQTFNNVLFGNNYTVVENSLPTGWDFVSINCSAGNVTPDSTVGATVTFDIDNAADILDCTYTNRARGAIKIVKNTVPSSDTTTSFQFNPSGFNGNASFNLVGHGANQTFSNLAPGSGYSITETVPAGWDLTGSSCDNGTVTGITVVAGQTTTCTFTNTKRGTIIVEKQTDPNGAPGNFTFAGTVSGTIQDNGQLTVANLAPGQYTSTENDPSPAFDLTSIVCDDANSTGNVGTRTATFNLEAGETVKCTFTNRQLHKVIVLVCHVGTNTLISSNVTNGSSTLASIGSPPGTLTHAQLCGLGGASFGGLPHGNKNLTVDVGSGTH